MASPLNWLNCWPEILGFRAPSTPFYKICVYRFTFKLSDIVSLTSVCNSELKRAIYRKKMLYNKFQKYNNSKNWEAYRRQRNYVTKLIARFNSEFIYGTCFGNLLRTGDD
jgi:hypothetical protein